MRSSIENYPDFEPVWQPLAPLAMNLADSDVQTQSPVRPRVCDTCIRKKVKCNQARPACSRCTERGENCVYSAKRRRPGPPPGSQRTSSKPRTASVLPGSRRTREEPSVVVDLLPSPPPSVPAAHQPVELRNQDCSPTVFESNREEQLLEAFFDILRDVNPIHDKARFLYDYHNSCCDSALISTITTITEKLTGSVLAANVTSIDTRIDSLLSSTALQESLFTDSPVLDEYRKSCVLAAYEFHQFPGHQSWMRLGSLARMALRTGLDRLEHLRAYQPEWRALSEQDMEEWRAVWWCIYRLDSYSNLASGTPYLISEDLVATAFILRNVSQSFEETDSVPQLLLSSHPENIWKLISTLSSYPGTTIANIHNITTTMMRQVGSLTRVYQVRPVEETNAKITEVERRFSALRLALPPNWLNPKRNAFSGERTLEHHERLVTNLQLWMTRLLLAIFRCCRQHGEEWLRSWEQVLETCQNIVAIAEQWDSSFCIKVDPAIAFVIFTSLIFLDLHEKSIATSGENLQAQIEHDKTVLRFMLEHFATIWTLPRLLSLSFATFSESIQGPLTEQHLKRILLRFEAPLHSRWLQFLSDPQKYLENSQ
ncbi:hypothetical protein BKA63DRAFT_518727 [Paraphoma chrysanthemicola]|nr:hypothetical protein BKA63DRAFT_518727 [Paraphoma chrysanthemicola]